MSRLSNAEPWRRIEAVERAIALRLSKEDPATWGEFSARLIRSLDGTDGGDDARYLHHWWPFLHYCWQEIRARQPPSVKRLFRALVQKTLKYVWGDELDIPRDHDARGHAIEAQMDSFTATADNFEAGITLNGDTYIVTIPLSRLSPPAEARLGWQWAETARRTGSKPPGGRDAWLRVERRRAIMAVFEETLAAMKRGSIEDFVRRVQRNAAAYILEAEEGRPRAPRDARDPKEIAGPASNDGELAPSARQTRETPRAAPDRGRARDATLAAFPPAVRLLLRRWRRLGPAKNVAARHVAALLVARLNGHQLARRFGLPELVRGCHVSVPQATRAKARLLAESVKIPGCVLPLREVLRRIQAAARTDRP